ncbi:hypothetical protein JVU11DRAFT_9017 [Chiua virens]|nr:hypothetical protein JVU11DRAFT_9017 [Chiua virens]
MLNVLTLYIVGTGVITAILRVVELSLAFAYPASLYFLIPYICTSKAYTNALLATLNSRASRRDGLSSGVATTIEYRPRSTHASEGIGMVPNDTDRSHTELYASDCSAHV